MKKRFLVATDFSPAATNATNYALDMARELNADIILFHVYQLPVSYNEIPVVVNEVEIKLQAEKGLSLLKKELTVRAAGRVYIETVVASGFFFQKLENICEEFRPYLVIMGCQGTTAADRLLFGNHAVHAMKYLQWPLISVSVGTQFSGIRKVGLACDFEKVLDTMPVDEIKMLVTDFNAELHVLNTSKSKQFARETLFEYALLQELIGTIKPEYHFIACENTDNGILEFIKLHHIDLLVVLPKRHSLIDKIVHRSHTKQLVLHSHIPVLALHKYEGVELGMMSVE